MSAAFRVDVGPVPYDTFVALGDLATAAEYMVARGLVEPQVVVSTDRLWTDDAGRVWVDDGGRSAIDG